MRGRFTNGLLVLECLFEVTVGIFLGEVRVNRFIFFSERDLRRCLVSEGFFSYGVFLIIFYRWVSVFLFLNEIFGRDDFFCIF